MDQEKIGKFIKERREKLGLTQKELADMVFISDKTVSKWEQGRGLMDITMLKPLSKVLKVSIPELINGSYIDKEKTSDDVIDNTFKYMNKKYKKDKMKTIILIFLIPIIIFFISRFIYKIYLINKYTIKENKELSLYLKSEEPRYLEIDGKFDLGKNPIIFGNFMFKNVFEGYEYIEPQGHTMLDKKFNPHQYVKYDKNGNVKSALIFRDTRYNIGINELTNYFSKEYYKSSKSKDTFYLNKSEIYSYLGKNNVNDDVDLVKYCRENYYFKNSLFSTIEQIKENRTFNKYCYSNHNRTVIHNITYLKGWHKKGFILDIPTYNRVNPDYYGETIDYKGLKRRDLYISSENLYIVLTFIGDELTTDEYIKDFIPNILIG